jgi:hypothetical protein
MHTCSDFIRTRFSTNAATVQNNKQELCLRRRMRLTTYPTTPNSGRKFAKPEVFQNRFCRCFGSGNIRKDANLRASNGKDEGKLTRDQLLQAGTSIEHFQAKHRSNPLQIWNLLQLEKKANMLYLFCQT